MSGPQWWVGLPGVQLYTAANNWSSSRGGAGGNGPPIAGDTVYIMDGNSQIAGSDQSAVSLANLYVDFAPYGSASSVPALSIGTSGVPLKFTIASGGTAKFTGGYGDMYLGPNFATDATPMLLLLGTGNHFLSGVTSPGTGTVLTGTNSGKVTIGSDWGTGSAFNVHGLGATIEMSAATSSSPPTVTIDDGLLTSSRNLAATTIDGGSLITQGTAAIAGTVSVKPGRTWTHNSSGTVTKAVLSSGSTALAGQVPFILTNADVYGNASLFQNSTSITYTNPPKVFRGGGGFAPD